MYQYDGYDKQAVRERAADFRDQVERRIAGKLSEAEFKPLRLQNGLYLQLHAYMLRVAIPYGLLSSKQMRKLAHIARTYDKDYGHFTTRQNIQYNWVKLVDAPDILDELASVEMHAIQTSGNCIRNISSDQFAGVAADEVEDPRPWCELLRQWSTFHPEFAFLPRKFKIAVNASPADRVGVKLHDIGITITHTEEGERRFAVYAGGGQGRTPMIAKLMREDVREEHLLSYLEAILRVYNRYGRRDNKYKARIKILVHETGEDAFRDEVEAEWQKIEGGPVDADIREFLRIEQYFAPPKYDPEATATAIEAAKRASRDEHFAAWVRNNVFDHKVDGYKAVTISLKPHDGIAGDATSAQMDAVADFADNFGFGELRVTHAQNLVLPDVKEGDLPALYDALKVHNLAEANQGLLTDMIVCPGLDYCALANARSIPVSQKIAKRFSDMGRLEDIGEVKLKISGCINACGHHHAGHIGILGVDRKGTENYQILLGGSAEEDTSLAQIIGRGFDEDGTVDAIETIIDVYKEERGDGETFLETYRRIGMKPFKEAVYGA
ncbi:MAG: nitrite/sulfite reductase [Pseudomonadota bacterium]